MNIVIFDHNRMLSSKLRNLLDICFVKLHYTSFKTFTLDKESIMQSDLSHIEVMFFNLDCMGPKGFAIASQLHSQYPNLLLILISERPDYAPAGYRIGGFRYLIQGQLESEIMPCVTDIMNTLYPERRMLRIRGEFGDTCINTISIIYMEGSPNRRVYLHTTSQSVVECHGKLADFTSQLYNCGFLRIQRGYLVNMRYITSIKNYWVVLDNGEQLKTSEKNFSELRTQYYSWKSTLNTPQPNYSLGFGLPVSLPFLSTSSAE